MLYTSSACPMCKEGAVGFRMLGDASAIVFMCDECNATWLQPDDIEPGTAIFPVAPYYRIGKLDSSISNAYGARWANRSEIVATGLEKYILGEEFPLNE